jgi:3-methyl-2-oxobutanoate hydroxymethyltransferase
MSSRASLATTPGDHLNDTVGATRDSTEPPIYPRLTQGRRVSPQDLIAAKARGEKWPMITAYDALTASVFDEAGIPVLLVGDSAAMVVLGHETTVPITVREMLPLASAVVRGSTQAMVVADLPFGSYQRSAEQALRTASRFLKISGVQAVKLEGGARVVPAVDLLVRSGIPVMAHLGLTPQSVNALGGYRVQGRGAEGEALLRDAQALESAGAFAIVLELVPSALARRVTESLEIPTIGIGAGPQTDSQVMVWQDLAGLTSGRTPRFVKRYADMRTTLSGAVRTWAAEVSEGTYPGPEHEYS